MAGYGLDITCDLNFTCHQCGHCCRQMSVPLMPGERERLADFDWASASPRLAGKELFVPMSGEDPRATPQFRLAHLGSSCAFLEENGDCLIHNLLGYQSKPLVCRQFPLVFVEEPHGTVVSASFVCSSLLQGSGEPLRAQGEAIRTLHHDPIWGAAKAEGARLSGRISVPDQIVLTARIGLEWNSYQAVESAMVMMLSDISRPLAARLLAMCRLVEGAVAEYGRGTKTDDPFANWMARMNSGEGQRWLYQGVSGNGPGRPWRQRTALAPLISLVESGWAAAQETAEAGGGAPTAIALARGREPFHLPSLSASIEPARMRRVGFAPDSPLLAPVLVRYLREWLRRKGLLGASNLLRGTRMLLVSFALVRWYSVALAVVRGLDRVGVEELHQGIRIVEMGYSHHNPLPRLLAQRPILAIINNLMLDLVAWPTDLVAWPAGSGPSPASPAAGN